MCEIVCSRHTLAFPAKHSKWHTCDRQAGRLIGKLAGDLQSMYGHKSHPPFTFWHRLADTKPSRGHALLIVILTHNGNGMKYKCVHHTQFDFFVRRLGLRRKVARSASAHLMRTAVRLSKHFSICLSVCSRERRVRSFQACPGFNLNKLFHLFNRAPICSASSLA